MRKHFGIFLATVIVALLSMASAASAQQGYFHVEKQNGVWWLIDPDGHRFVSTGVDNVNFQGDVIHGTNKTPYYDAVVARYGTRAAWRRATLRRLRDWGFNTLGAWSEPSLFPAADDASGGMAFTVLLDIAAASGADWQHGRPLDVFAPALPRNAAAIAQRVVARFADNRRLLGYFSDNEMRWGPDWRGKRNMLEMYLAMPAGSPGRAHSLAFLQQRYRENIQALNRAWGIKAKDFDRLPDASGLPPAAPSGPGASSSTLKPSTAFWADSDAFLAQVAERYFSVCADAIRQADHNHLYLGARFAGMPPDVVLRAARVADAVSINVYSRDPRPVVQHVYEQTGRPVLIGEFAFRALDSGLPNSQGAGPKVANQTQRGQAYSTFVDDLLSLPEAVGYHWFEWADEPLQGRFDGENSNYGLVNIHDDPYAAFVAQVKTTNQQAVALHARAKVPAPQPAP